jgi:hypothetical protein
VELALRLALPAAALALCWRRLPRFRVERPAAGLIYNWWAVRSKSLGDRILAHGVTNAALAVFVILTKRWEYWM